MTNEPVGFGGEWRQHAPHCATFILDVERPVLIDRIDVVGVHAHPVGIQLDGYPGGGSMPQGTLVNIWITQADLPDEPDTVSIPHLPNRAPECPASLRQFSWPPLEPAHVFLDSPMPGVRHTGSGGLYVAAEERLCIQVRDDARYMSHSYGHGGKEPDPWLPHIRFYEGFVSVEFLLA